MRARSLTVASAATTIAILGSLLASPVLGATRSPAAGRSLTSGGGGGAAAPLPAATCTLSASTRTCHLWAETGTISLPGAGSVDVWGYALGSSAAPSGDAQLPGPTLVANEGENLHVVLHNDLADASSMAFPGHDEIADDTVGAAAVGGTKAYDLPGLSPGTFLYEAGPTAEGAKQVAMGLYGALIVRPLADPTSGYGDAASDFTTEELLVVSEIDTALHAAPGGFDMREYHPTYWLFNGRTHPDIPEISAAASSRVLLRYVNAGLENQSVGVLGMHQTVVAGSGHVLSHPYQVVAETIPAGGTLDAVATIPAGAAGTRLAIQSAAGHTDNAGASTGGIVAFGGMLALIDVTAAPAGDTDGPATTGLTLSDTLPPASFGVTMSATGDDTASGGSNVDGAEWFADAACIAGGGQPMTLGGPPAVTLGMSASIDVALQQGIHTIRVHSRDASGNWGPCAEATMDVQDILPAADTIFIQNFESGDLSDWSTAGGSALAEPTAALKGSTIGLEVNPSAGAGFVVDKSPRREKSYRARFWYDPNTSLRGAHTIFEGRTGQGGQLFRIEARRTNDGAGAWSIRALVRRTGGFSSTGWFVISDGPHAIEIAWKAGTRATFSLSIDGKVKRTLRRLDTHRYRLESVRLGTAASGTARAEYFDEFVSTRGSRIGP